MSTAVGGPAPKTYFNTVGHAIDQFDSACSKVYAYIRPFAGGLSVADNVVKLMGEGSNAWGKVSSGLFTTMAVTTSVRAVPALHDFVTLRVFFEINPNGDFKKNDNGKLIFKDITVMARDVLCNISFILVPISRWESAGAYTLPKNVSVGVNSTISGLFAAATAFDVIVQIQKLSKAYDTYKEDPTKRKALVKQAWHLERSIVELIVSPVENGYSHLSTSPVFAIIASTGIMIAGVNNLIVDIVIDNIYSE